MLYINYPKDLTRPSSFFFETRKSFRLLLDFFREKNNKKKFKNLNLIAMEMEIKKINLDQTGKENNAKRPETFEEFIGQEPIKKVLKTAIESAKKRESSL